ncbi:MAG: cell surface protein SprA, partial [Bacteroidota bacterium]
MQFKKFIKYTLSVSLVIPVLGMVWGTNPAKFSGYSDLSGTRIPIPADTPFTDTLHYPFHDRHSDPYSSQYNNSPLYLNDPENIKTTIEYNPEEKEYDINERMGDLFYRDPSYMTFEEFKEAQFKNSTKKYWQQRSSENDILQRKGFNPKIYVGSDVFDRIFGGNTIDIRPQGSAELTFGLNIQHNENPAIPVKQRTNTSFDFKEKIQMNVIGNIGEKMKLGVNYNTEAGFDFENKMKLEYTGKEDEIIQKIEAGNITLPLTGSLIQGTQTLFGIKTALKFGRMNVTTVFSQQKGQRSTINVPPGGGQITNYEIQADQYEANKHFFLAQYFKDNYDKALKNLPVVNSPITITKIEVWKTNRVAATEANRDVVAFMDLGEYNYFSHNLISQGTSVYPSDSLSNNLYRLMNTTYKGIRNGDNAAAILGSLNPLPTGFTAQQDYVVIRNAKKLNTTEYTFNARLGYISLNSTLNPDEAIAVSYEYTIGNNVYRVGELSTAGVEPPNTLILKLLRSKIQSPSLPTWDLMMKNIYSLNGYQVQKENFKLDVFYADDADGGKKKRYISAGVTEPLINGTPLIKLFGLDTLNSNGDAGGDGVFDFVEGITINTANGRIIFPEREPFGTYLQSKFNDQNVLAKKYVYQELYDSTLTVAQQFAIKNKFSIGGSYQSASGAEISLNAINIPQGSVTVTAGGQPLVENTDFTVDYNLGRVKIINAGILASNTPIQVSVESQSLFSIQSKTLIGARFDYAISKDFTIGGTYLHLNERPITQKVNIGDEPISNTIWGVDGTYRTESRFITKMIDKLPFLATKEKSSVTFSGEFAQLIPGHSSAIGSAGNAYIDDFEGSQSTIDIRNANTWFLASTPLSNPTLFPETVGGFADSITYGFNRARLAWYTIDPSVFYRDNTSLLPSNITKAELSNNNVRAVLENEIFPNKENPNNVQTELSVL